MKPFEKRTFDATASYLVKGADLNAIYAALRERTLVQGPGILLRDTDGGCVIESTATGGVAAGTLAFYTVTQAAGVWMLQGGQVSGSEGNEVVPNIELATVGLEPANGTLVWLEVTGNGTVTEGILYGGYEVTAADWDEGLTLPANTLPTVADSTGRKFHHLLGMWDDDVFIPSGPGHLGVTFCPSGGYSPSRF